VKSFAQLATWPCPTVAAATIGPDGAVHRHGDTTHVFALASVTKLFTAAAIHLSVEEGSLALTDPMGDRGPTVADLLAHAGGRAPNGDTLDDPGRRRIYSNGGYEELGELLESRTEMSPREYLAEGIFNPLGMTQTSLISSPAFGAESTVEDLVRFVTGLTQLLAPETLTAMTTPHLPELIGVLPGYGRQSPNPWGLGPEIRSTKEPHWTGATNSPQTWGHFGQAGTFLWVDPVVNITCIALTDRPFGDWATQCWPSFSDSVRNELLG
jgi:CubicO group peptidase (beta-lactamase class C family)